MFQQHVSHAGALRRLFGRPSVQAAAYLLVAAAVVGFGLVRFWDVFSLVPDDARPPGWAVAVPFASCGLVLLKRRAPLLGLVAAAVLFVSDLLLLGSIVTLIVLLEMLHSYTVVLGGAGRRRVLLGVAIATVVLAAAAWAVTGELRMGVLIGLQFGAMLGFAFWYANSIAQSQELVGLYRQRAEDASRLAELDREAAVRSERERMARELHDVVAGHVAAVAIRSEAALTGAGSDADERIASGDRTGGREREAEDGRDGGREREALRAARDASLDAHGALRSMIAVLRKGTDDIAAPVGRELIPKLVEEARRSGVRVTLIDEAEGPLAPPVDHALGRVVQEALANCARHASGADVEVRLEADGREIVASVVSRGGRALARPGLEGTGMGLEMLAERVRATGGRFEAGAEDGGWAVRARLPREERR
ncbi:sensor histidine kinase [Leucobacter sp. CSA1]|uniref:histidine kinase n=1 Tax=Leucobacter chromiisoli TaxID=2796471 RepID=A0A934UVP7_9MICO|nr:histidine kinase [Leucobacter chromiisoli]MBK0419706.1 sensor histidine kinase [Leucobacter chromiisoli]